MGNTVNHRLAYLVILMAELSALYQTSQETLYEHDSGEPCTEQAARKLALKKLAEHQKSLKELRSALETKSLDDLKLDCQVDASRVCGCVDESCQACIDASGGPCHWVEKDLCSRCANELKAKEALIDA